MSLKDYKSDESSLETDGDAFADTDKSEIPGAQYHEEINTLKIDKLSNRVTIISIILPCLIGAVLVFAYLDMKERVVDADMTKQTQVEKISTLLEEKLNALDVKIAKNRFDLDNKLPELSQKDTALEGQLAKLTAAKADTRTIDDKLSKLEKRIGKNASQDKETIQTLARVSKETLAAISENQAQFAKNTQQIKDEITLFKEELDARLLELSDYEQQIGELRKNLSLLDKKVKTFEQDRLTQAQADEKLGQLNTDLVNRTSQLENQIKTLNQKLTANVSRLQKDLDLLIKSNPSAKTGTKVLQKPSPQIKIDSSNSTTIEEEPLTQ